MAAPDLRPAMTLSAISRRLVASSFLRRSLVGLSARAAAKAGWGPFLDQGGLEVHKAADHLHHHPGSLGAISPLYTGGLVGISKVALDLPERAENVKDPPFAGRSGVDRLR